MDACMGKLYYWSSAYGGLNNIYLLVEEKENIDTIIHEDGGGPAYTAMMLRMIVFKTVLRTKLFPKLESCPAHR